MPIKVERSRFYCETVADIEPHCIGIQAKVNVFIPCPAPSRDKIIQEITSPGIWAVEGDSDPEYVASIYAAECAILEHMLTSMGLVVVP